MIVLDNADKLQGDTTTASKVDYTVHGVVGTTITQLADGQLASSKGDLYTSSADSTVIASITLVNTNTSAEVVNLYILPSGGTARRILPQDLSLGIDYSLIFDGNKIEILDDSGRILQSHAGSGRAANYVVAANGAPTHVKKQADYVCDGTDDHVQIQAALDALPATGGKILLTEGTFTNEAAITLDSYQTLQGMGRSTILTTTTANLDIITATGSSGSEKVGILLADFCIDGDAGSVTNDMGIYWEYVDDSKITNVYSQDNGEQGIYLNLSDSNIITGCTLQNSTHVGIYLNTSNYNAVIGNYCYYNYTGMTLEDSLYNTITGNTLQYNDPDGIYTTGSTYNTIEGNTFESNWEVGIDIEGASDYCTVVGNTSQGNGSAGIYIYASDGVTVSGNVCQGNGTSGIEFEESDDDTVLGNSCHGNDQYGLYAELINDSIIMGNSFTENSQDTDDTYDDISIWNDSNYNNIQGNICRAGGETNKPRYGINIGQATCDSNKVINNDLYDDGFGTAPYNDSGTGTIYVEPGIDDTPVNGEVAQPISSNWAYDHAATGAHSYMIWDAGVVSEELTYDARIAFDLGTSAQRY